MAAPELRVGMRVYVPKLRAEADIVEISGNNVRVAAGPLKLSTTIAELRSAQRDIASPQRNTNKAKPSKILFDAAADPDVPLQTSDNTVDLRGLRAHEATAIAEQFLDRTMGAGMKVAFLIHGHGTGALRDAVRDMLRASHYVSRTRPGEPREGGDGVTVVWLR